MKNKIGIFLAIAMLAVLVVPASASQSKLVPITSIISVVQDQSITIRTDYFPANDTYNVFMGLSGTQGIGGILVSKLTTGVGGSILAKFHIPSELQGQQIISIRLESPTSGYFSYNWFYNSTAAVVVPYYSSTSYSANVIPVVPTWRGIQEGFPRFDITSVSKGGSVSVRLMNMPANINYAVTMKDSRSAYTTWYDVAVFNSGDGGIFNAIWNIPTALQFRPMISIKIYNKSTKIFIVNLFYNE